MVMNYRKLVIFGMTVLFISLAFSLAGCKQKLEIENKKSHQAESAISYKKIPLPLEKIKRVMGWISEDEVLVHGGTRYRRYFV